jgi:hypothetical protein
LQTQSLFTWVYASVDSLSFLRHKEAEMLADGAVVSLPEQLLDLGADMTLTDGIAPISSAS